MYIAVKESMIKYLNQTEETYIQRNWAVMHLCIWSIWFSVVAIYTLDSMKITIIKSSKYLCECLVKKIKSRNNTF